MSSGNEPSSERSGGEGPSISGSLFPELEMVRDVRPLAVRLLSSVTPLQQAEGVARESGHVVPSIMADGESTDKEEVLRIKLGEIYAEPMRLSPRLRLVDEKEEEEEETKETGKAEEVGRAEEEGEAEEEESSNPVAGGKRRKKRPVVLGAFNLAMGGEVSYLKSKLTVDDLERIERTNAGGPDIFWRLPTDQEVACSDATPEVCLFEHMFSWGMRIRADPEDRLRGFIYLLNVHNSYGLSPGQLTANAFLTILGFWGYIRSRMEKEILLLVGPFSYFFELKEKKK